MLSRLSRSINVIVQNAMKVVFCRHYWHVVLCAVDNKRNNKRGFTEHGILNNCLKVFPILAIMFEMLCNDWLIL